MAFTDSGAGIQTDTAGPDSSGTGRGGQGAPQARGMPPEPSLGPILSALQRQAQGPQPSAPGPGNMADSLGKLQIAVDLMEMAKSGFEPETGQYEDILKALENLRKYLPEHGNQSALEETHLMDLLRRGKQNPILQAVSGILGGGQGGGQGPQPPMPSTPLPGA